jgi:hypothetical protein
MTCWYVAWKDLKILFKDTGALILLFILPIVVITIASYALSDIFQDQLKPPRVLLVDLDQSHLRPDQGRFNSEGGLNHRGHLRQSRCAAPDELRVCAPTNRGS